MAKQYPDVHLSPGYEFDQGDNKWSLGLTITLPVLNQNRGGIAEAEAKRLEAGETFLALQARVMAEIDRAQAAYEAALRKSAETQTLVADLEKQEQSAKALLEAGEISKSDLTALRLQLSVTSLARLDAFVKSLQALGQLEEALQSPFNVPESAWQNPPQRTSTMTPTYP